MRIFRPWAYSLPRPGRLTGVRSSIMSSLREFQRQFVEALFDGSPDGRSGIEIYRNNLHEGFLKALALEFPVIQRLVGEAYFRQLVCCFLLVFLFWVGVLFAFGVL